MPTLFEFSQAISKLNKEKKYPDALLYFKDHKVDFAPEAIGANKFIVYDIIAALIELNRYDAIFPFLQIHKVSLDPKNFSFLLKKFKDKPSINWAVVCKFCDLVSPDILDTECRTIEVERKGVKKPMELASNKEDWYAIKTKALFELHNYEDCFNLSKIALETFDKFHYSNDVWFARRIALSKKNMGNVSEALSELLQVLKRKKEWFIQKELADLYHEMGDNDKAFKYAIDAINNFGDLEFKVDLLYLLGELLAIKNEMEFSFKHYSLSQLIRKNEEWNVPAKLSSALSKFDKPAIPIDKLNDLLGELKKFWNSFKMKDMVDIKKAGMVFTGKIEKILHNDQKGTDGFIKYDGGKSVYFRVDSAEEVIKKIIVGLSVNFKILPANGEKKERAIIKGVTVI